MPHAKPRTISSVQALGDVMRACSLYEPRIGVTNHDSKLDQQRRHIDQQIAAIIKKHKLRCTDAELLFVVSIAADHYWTWHYFARERQEGLGEKSVMSSLVSALLRVRALLDDVKVRNRLAKTLQTTPASKLPADPSQGLDYDFGDSAFSSISHSRAQIAGLLAIAESAENLDGRNDAAKRRDDLRVAVAPLLKYWTQCEKRTGKLFYRGGAYSKCVTFVHDCLLLIDPNATKQLIVDL